MNLNSHVIFKFIFLWRRQLFDKIEIKEKQLVSLQIIL